MNLWIVTTAIFGCTLIDSGTTLGQKTANDLTGKWKLESYTNEGVKKLASDPDTSFFGQRIKIENNNWVEWYSGDDSPPKSSQRDTPFGCLVKPGMPYQHFDQWPIGPNKKPDTWKKVGIYKIEGDQLMICFRTQPIPGKSVKRPTEFDASKGSGTGLAVYKRIVPK